MLKEVCETHRAYDKIDLTQMPADYLPRTNYVPACSFSEYRRRVPAIPWDKTESVKLTDYYQVIHRRMLTQVS